MNKDKPRELSDIILRAPNMRPRVGKADFNIFLNVISYVDGIDGGGFLLQEPDTIMAAFA